MAEADNREVEGTEQAKYFATWLTRQHFSPEECGIIQMVLQDISQFSAVDPKILAKAEAMRIPELTAFLISLHGLSSGEVVRSINQVLRARKQWGQHASEDQRETARGQAPQAVGYGERRQRITDLSDWVTKNKRSTEMPAVGLARCFRFWVLGADVPLDWSSDKVVDLAVRRLVVKVIQDMVEKY